MEGFYVSGKYVAKELTIMFDENKYQHFMFDQPIDLVQASKDQNTIRFCQNLNGLQLRNDCFLPYDIIGYILNKIKHNCVYTAGNQPQRFLKAHLLYRTQ